jgi:hypothetical protein
MLGDEDVHYTLPLPVIAENQRRLVPTDPELVEQLLVGVDRSSLVVRTQRVPAPQCLHQRIEAGEEATARVVCVERWEEPWLDELDQRVELERMELHGGRREQEQPIDELLQLIGQPVGLRRPRLVGALERPPDAVGLVEDDEVPFGVDDLLSALGVGRERQRADDVLARCPRIDAAFTEELERCAVEDLEVLVELGAKLTLPLKLEACGHDDQDSVDELPCAEFLDDESGFDRLPEADLVGKDHARLQLLRHAVGDEHLVELGLDPCAGQTGQRVVAVRVLQVQGLQTQAIGLGAAELARGKALFRALRELLEFLGMDPDRSRWKGYLDQDPVSDTEDHSVLACRHTADPLSRYHAPPSPVTRRGSRRAA